QTIVSRDAKCHGIRPMVEHKIHVMQEDREDFEMLVLDEFKTMHAGNAVRFGLRPLAFLAGAESADVSSRLMIAAKPSIWNYSSGRSSVPQGLHSAFAMAVQGNLAFCYSMASASQMGPRNVLGIFFQKTGNVCVTKMRGDLKRGYSILSRQTRIDV